MPLGDAQRPLYEIKANLFKGLAHPYRIRVLEILSSSPETPVSELVAETGLEPSHLSQHLAVLRRYGLVRSERRASVVYYRLAFAEVAELLRVARHLLFGILTDSQAHGAAAAHLPHLSDGFERETGTDLTGPEQGTDPERDADPEADSDPGSSDRGGDPIASAAQTRDRA